MDYEYTLIRSNRKTLSLEVKSDLSVVVRAPARCPEVEIRRFVSSHGDWLEKNIKKLRARLEENPEPTLEEQLLYISRAKSVLPLRVEHYAGIMRLSPAGIKITSAKKRLGSCSSKNSLCFSWRLMAFPDEAIDYVVVHELAHIVHKNHGSDFYALVETVLPDYTVRKKLLKR